MDVSVIICTHNPRRDYLERVLTALREQTLPYRRWDLVIIDNASTEPVGTQIDMSWHPCGRVIRENQLGLTHARLRGIGETSADLLVFVDDDNMLAPDYLSQAIRLFEENTHLGACSGNALGKFESEPPGWVGPYLPFLGLRRIEKAQFTNELFDWAAMPIGAGLCLRRSVAATYAKLCGESAPRRALDRAGQSLTSGGDNDLAMVALDLGLKIGVSPVLTLTHLIPAARYTEEYIIRLMEGITFSGCVLSKLRNMPTEPPRHAIRDLASCLKVTLTRSGIERKIYFARRRGHRAFIQWSRQS